MTVDRDKLRKLQWSIMEQGIGVFDPALNADR